MYEMFCTALIHIFDEYKFSFGSFMKMTRYISQLGVSL